MYRKKLVGNKTVPSYYSFFLPSRADEQVNGFIS
jgi:hypothetical protein